MATRRRNGFQDSVESEEVLPQTVEEGSVVITELEPEPEPVQEPAVLHEETQPEPQPQKVLPVRLLEKPKLPDKRRNVPRFSRVKP